jgi:(p)ppGpp synthase/HD superfamily hydrolase
MLRAWRLGVTMRSFALTYPQLMNQARAGAQSGNAISVAGGSASVDAERSDAVVYDDDALTELRRVYELAERMCDGVYRPNGAPFLCHVTRTASIAMAEERPRRVVHACLLHAIYGLRYAGGRHRWFSWRGRRRDLREIVGKEVEGLVHAYDQLPWNSTDALREHLAKLDDYDETTRDAVFMRLANELEDHLDNGTGYEKAARASERAGRRDECARLARRLGADELAEELEEALDASREELPSAVVLNRELGYSVATKRLPELTGLRRFARRVLNRIRGRSV